MEKRSSFWFEWNFSLFIAHHVLEYSFSVTRMEKLNKKWKTSIHNKIETLDLNPSWSDSWKWAKEGLNKNNQK